MKIVNLEISGLKLIIPEVYPDNRGFFLERYNKTKLAELGFNVTFVQDNMSHSKPGVIRGLHFQARPCGQGKLVGVTKGRILDIAVDIRPKSATFGRHVAVELNAETMSMLWLPAGFAHGFCVLGNEEADVLYKCDNYRNMHAESGIRWDDAELAIKWPIQNPVVSEKDKVLPSFKEFRSKK